MAKSILKISPDTRARLLFYRELVIDISGGKNIANKPVLDGLVLQRAKMEKQRDSQMGVLVFCIFLLIFIQNGGDIKVPGLDILVSQVPAVDMFLVSVGACLLFLLSLVFINISSYTGLIDQYANLHSGPVDQEIYSASLSPHWLAFKVLSREFNHKHKVYINPGKISGFHLWASETLVGLVLYLFVAITYLYLFYYAAFQIENTMSGIIIKSVSILVMLISLYLSWVSSAKFDFVSEEVDEGPSDNSKGNM